MSPVDLVHAQSYQLHLICKIHLAFSIFCKFKRKVFSFNVLCVLQSKCVDMKFNIVDDRAAGTKASFVDVNFSKLEAELKDYIIKQEVRMCGKALKFDFFCVDPAHSYVQILLSHKPHCLCAFSVLGSTETVLP